MKTSQEDKIMLQICSAGLVDQAGPELGRAHHLLVLDDMFFMWVGYITSIYY